MHMTQLQRGAREMPPENNDRGHRLRLNIYPNGRRSEGVNVIMWEFPDGRPAEVYISSDKLGSVLDQHLKLLGKDISRLLQYGMPVAELAHKLIGESGPLAGTTNLVAHPQTSGISDLIGRLLAERYSPGMPLPPPEEP